MTPLAHLAYPEKCKLGGVRWRALWEIRRISLYPIACYADEVSCIHSIVLGVLGLVRFEA